MLSTLLSLVTYSTQIPISRIQLPLCIITLVLHFFSIHFRASARNLLTMSFTNARTDGGSINHVTRILPVDPSRIGQFKHSNESNPWLDPWELSLREDTPDALHLKEAATLLRSTSTPVAFPTETVYGLGADATRSEAVKGIYKAKQRPSDNPLIVHVCSLDQLRSLLRLGGRQHIKESSMENGVDVDNRIRTSVLEEACMNSTERQIDSPDPIPAIYQTLIRRFWPGPLTILLPNPPDSLLAREVTAGLNTFGARIPDNPLALALIKLAGVPVAAPSANASTKPSPTTAEHVKEDLDGRIGVILDGGPCSVGVESTVVDGLSDPPSILRPGGISIEQLRQYKGWENVVLGYKQGSVGQNSTPKAPGMKYRHYSPKARVILYLPRVSYPSTVAEKIRSYLAENRTKTVGIIRTKSWGPFAGLTKNEPATPSSNTQFHLPPPPPPHYHHSQSQSQPNGFTAKDPSPNPTPTSTTLTFPSNGQEEREITIWDVRLGPSTSEIARGIFSALRSLDHKAVEVIFVEGIPDDEGDLAAAVMNRLTKAAS